MIYLKNPLCLGMEKSEYKEMLALGGMRQKHFEKNEVILSAGCTTHEIGLVLSGSVNIENLDLWGSKSILSNIGAGQVFGETYAFFRETLMVDAVAAQQTDILFWNLDILVHTPHPASTWQPKFIRNLLQISLRKNLALSQRIFCTTPKTIRGRLLVYLSNQAAKAGSNYFKIPFDRQGLADYLNVDRSALSKELGKMRDEGILTPGKMRLPYTDCLMSRSFMFHFQRPFTNNTNEKSERLQKKEPCPDIFPDRIPFYYVLLLCQLKPANQIFQSFRLCGKLLACCRSLFRSCGVALYDTGNLLDSLLDLL